MNSVQSIYSFVLPLSFVTLIEQAELISNNNYKVVSLIPRKMYIEMYTHSNIYFCQNT